MLGPEHRLKIIECMNFRQFQSGEPVFLKYKDKHLKIVVCLKGRLVLQSDLRQDFLGEGEVFGASEMYCVQQAQFEANVIAEPFAFVGEITREAIEQAIGEDFH